MSNKTIHDINITVGSSDKNEAPTELTNSVLKQLALVAKAMAKKQVQPQTEPEGAVAGGQMANTQKQNANTGGGVTGNTGSMSASATTPGNTTPSVSGNSTANKSVTSGTNTAQTNTMAPTEGGASVVPSATDSNTPSVVASPNNTSTANTYAGVSSQQTIQVPAAQQSATTEPSLETVKKAVAEKLRAATSETDITYWKDIKDKLETGTAPKALLGEKNELFTKLYTSLSKGAVQQVANTEVYNINWDDVSGKMIAKLKNLPTNNPQQKTYYEWMIKELNNPADIKQLFEAHDELFLLLKLIMPDLPSTINITFKKNIYPSLTAKKMYPDLGVENMYFIASGGQLNTVVIKATTYKIGEVEKNIFGHYPDLEKGQWKKEDRENPTKKDSTFWKASLYNTKNGFHNLYKTIEQRHAYYKFVDAYLKTEGIVSEWFDAAAKVTMYSPFTGEVGVGAADEGTLSEIFYLSVDVSKFLQGGNEFLFDENMNNVKLLIEGKGTISVDFEDARGNTQSFKDLTKEDLDLKLVEFEQTVVQNYINEYLREHRADGFVRDFYEFIGETTEDDLQEIMEEVNGNFDFWLTEDVTQDLMAEHFTKNGKIFFDFAKYEHRVKLGKIMIEALYYQREKTDFKTKNIDVILKNPDDNKEKIVQGILKYDKSLIPPEKPKKLKECYQAIKKDGERLLNIIDNYNNYKEQAQDMALGYLINEYKQLKENLTFKNLKKNANSVYNNLQEAYNENKKTILEKLDQLEKYYQEQKEELANPEKVEENIDDLYNLLEKNYQEQKESLQNKLAEATDVDNIHEKVKEELEEAYANTKETFQKIDHMANNPGQYLQKLWDVRDAAIAHPLIKTAELLYPKVASIEDNDKDKIFKKDYKATVAILLYEFAAGEGKAEHNFEYGKHDFATKILDKKVITEILEKTLALLERIDYDFVNMPDSIVLQPNLAFSPSPGIFIESIDKHLSANLAQFFIGGSIVRVQIKSGNIVGYIYNETSRESYALHVPIGKKGRSTNNASNQLTTVIQRVYFSFKLPEYHA